MISGAMKRGFPDFTTFIAMNLTADNVKVLERPQFEAIPLGPLLPIILNNGKHVLAKCFSDSLCCR